MIVPLPQRLPIHEVRRALLSIGFTCTRQERRAYIFKRDDIILVYFSIDGRGFDVVHLFADADVHGFAEELWDALNEDEGMPPEAS